MKRTYTKEDIVDGFRFRHKRYTTEYTCYKSNTSNQIKVHFPEGNTEYSISRILTYLNNGIWIELGPEIKPLYEIY